jgi:hypothetical protein
VTVWGAGDISREAMSHPYMAQSMPVTAMNPWPWGDDTGLMNEKRVEDGRFALKLRFFLIRGPNSFSVCDFVCEMPSKICQNREKSNKESKG